MSPSVIIIVLNWNGAADTVACVQSLRNMRHPSFEILIVDNGSTASDVARLRAALPDTPLLQNSRNLGFAEGNNVAIRQALERGAEYVLLLNNDTIVDPDFLTALTDAAQAQRSAGFLGAKIYYYADPTRIWMGKPMWDPAACRFEYVGRNALDGDAQLDAVSVSSYACGCAVLVTREALQRVGLMDPRFFCYYEEVDWCFRGARVGFQSLYVPAAKLWHKVSASSGGKQSPVVRYFRTRNSLLWAERHLGLRQRWRLFANAAREAHAGIGWRAAGPLACLQRAYWNLLILHRDPLLYAWRRGVWDYVCRRFGDAPPAIYRLPRGV